MFYDQVVETPHARQHHEPPNKMIKFHTDTDKQLFLLEVGKRLDEADSPGDHNLFIHRRKLLGSLFKDFRRSQNAKLDWNRHHFRMQSAIGKYHRSSAGRKFHRHLGTFLATRIPLTKQGLFARTEDFFAAKELVSLLNEELQFYMSVPDQLLVEEIIELLQELS